MALPSMTFWWEGPERIEKGIFNQLSFFFCKQKYSKVDRIILKVNKSSHRCKPRVGVELASSHPHTSILGEGMPWRSAV